MPLCDAPEWKEGHRYGEIGKPIPKKRDGSPQSKQWLAGYYYGLRTLAWGLWAAKHNRPAVYGHGPWPEHDPPPMTSAECAFFVSQQSPNRRAS